MNLFRILLIVLVGGNAVGQAYAETWLSDFESSLQSSYSKFLKSGSATNALPLLPDLPTPEQNLINIVARVKHAASASWADMPQEKFVGHYSNPGPSIRGCRYGSNSLSGNDLYLFPDSTYVYAEWGDLKPLTIYGKGVWSESNGVVRLTDDGQIRGASPIFLAVILTNTVLPDVFTNVIGNRLFLIEDTDGRFPGHILRQESDIVIGGLEHTKSINKKEMTALKSKLMKECWRPDFFKAEKDD